MFFSRNQIHNFETVAQILYRWCDKDCDIFNVLCTVLYVFIQCPTINKVIKSVSIENQREIYAHLNWNILFVCLFVANAWFYGDSRSDFLATWSKEVGCTQRTNEMHYTARMDACFDAKRKANTANAWNQFWCSNIKDLHV